MIETTSLYTELTNSYLQYSCSIFNRALPNVIDGLKTAQRRIILGLKDLNLAHDGTFKKVSRLEGHVLGSYHPNGGCAGTAINMGQCDAFRYPLTNIHGNVGGSIQVGPRAGQSLDESPPAAARYLEIKSTHLTDEVFLKECDKFVSKWVKNYDGSTEEISFFVPSMPTLLINGSTGIATGFAAHHVSYNATEVLNATIALVDNPNMSISTLRGFVPAPDFPNYARVLDKNIEEVLEFGSGNLQLFGEWEVIEVPYKKKSTRKAIRILSLASGNSERFVEMLYKAIEEEKILSVAEVSNLSSRHGIEIHVILKPNVNPQEAIYSLLKNTNLSSTISVNATGLLPNEVIPKKFGFREIVASWYEARSSGLLARFKEQISACEAKLEILEGLLKVLADIDAVIAIIKSAPSIAKAHEVLATTYNLTSLQTKAILDMSLKALVKQQHQELLSEHKKLTAHLKKLQKLVSSKSNIKEYIKSELESLKSLFEGDIRRSQLIQEVHELKAKPTSAPEPTTLKDNIISEGKKLGMSAREISEFLSKHAGSGVKKAWEEFKSQAEFSTAAGRRQRNQKLSELKQKALKQGLPTKGKNGWNAFMVNKERMPYPKVEKEMKKWLTNLKS
jgi:DNA gyrase subunit A